MLLLSLAHVYVCDVLVEVHLCMTTQKGILKMVQAKSNKMLCLKFPDVLLVCRKPCGLKV